MIKKQRLTEVEELAEVTDYSNNDGVVQTFKTRLQTLKSILISLSFTTPQHVKTFLFPFANQYNVTIFEASRRNIFDIESLRH